MTFLRALLPAALLLLAAGCVGTEEPVTESAAREPDVELGVCPEEGCAGAADPLETAREEAAPVAEAFRFEGRTGTSACAVTEAAVQCGRAVAPEWAPPALASGRPLAFQATVTSDDPLAAEHEYYLSLWVDLGNGWEWDPEREPVTTGPVPLAADWDVSAYPAGAKFLLWVEAYRHEGPLYVVADQPYAAEGMLTHVPIMQ